MLVLHLQGVRCINHKKSFKSDKHTHMKRTCTTSRIYTLTRLKHAGQLC